VEDRKTTEKILSAAGVRLRRDETALAALTLEGNGAGEGPGKQGCLVLTGQRVFHISGPSANAQVKSALLQDVCDAELVKQPRYHVFLLPAGFFLVIGFAYFIAVTMAGAFQPIVLVPTLLFGGGFIALWWYSRGNPVIRVQFGDTPLEHEIGAGQMADGAAFLDQLAEIKEKAG
jgi:hypothetical protein